MKYVIFAILFLSTVALAVEVSTLAKVSVNPIFNLSLNIDASDDVKQGENFTLNATLRSTNLTKIIKQIEVGLDYEITKGKNIIKIGNFSANVTDEVNVNLKISTDDINPGKYTLRMIASHNQAIRSQDEDEFFVKKLKFNSVSILSRYFPLLFELNI